MGPAVQLKIYEMVKDKFPDHVDHDAIKQSMDDVSFDFQNFSTVYEVSFLVNLFNFFIDLCCHDYQAAIFRSFSKL